MHLIIRFVGVVAGVLLSALLYWWMWTETGPFAWLASLFSPLGNLGMRLTFASLILLWLVGLFFCVPALSRMIAALRPTNERSRDAADSGISHGILLVPAVGLLLCAWGTIGGVISRHPVELKASELVGAAGWWPREAKAEPALWAMDGGLEPMRFPGAAIGAQDIFVPVDIRLADNPKATRVFIRTDSETVKKYQGNLEMQRDLIAGTLAHEPLPHRVRAEMKRRGWGSPIFAVVLQQNRGVSGYWFGALMLHLVPLLVLVANRVFRGKPAKAMPGAGAETARQMAQPAAEKQTEA